MADVQQRHGEAPVADLSNLATREDLTELRSDVSELRSRLEYMATKEDLADLRTRLEYMATKEDLAELRGEFAGLRGSLRTAGWFAGLVIGLVVAMVQIALFLLQRSLA